MVFDLQTGHKKSDEPLQAGTARASKGFAHMEEKILGPVMGSASASASASVSVSRL